MLSKSVSGIVFVCFFMYELNPNKWCQQKLNNYFNHEKGIFTYITTKQTSTFKQFYHLLSTDKDEPNEIFPKAKNQFWKQKKNTGRWKLFLLNIMKNSERHELKHANLRKSEANRCSKCTSAKTFNLQMDLYFFSRMYSISNKSNSHVYLTSHSYWNFPH